MILFVQVVYGVLASLKKEEDDGGENRKNDEWIIVISFS